MFATNPSAATTVSHSIVLDSPDSFKVMSTDVIFESPLIPEISAEVINSTPRFLTCSTVAACALKASRR